MSINQKRLMTGAFLTVVGMGFALGKVMGGTFWNGVLGLVWSFVALFVGAVLGYMHLLGDAQRGQESLKRELDVRQTSIELEREDLNRQKIRLGQDNMGLVRAVTDRAVNRILSKYVPGLSQKARREQVFADVEEIISEELGRELAGTKIGV